MNWNPDARDPWPATRYLDASPPRSSWWLVAVALALVIFAKLARII